MKKVSIQLDEMVKRGMSKSQIVAAISGDIDSLIAEQVELEAKANAFKMCVARVKSDNYTFEDLDFLRERLNEKQKDEAKKKRDLAMKEELDAVSRLASASRTVNPRLGASPLLSSKSPAIQMVVHKDERQGNGKPPISFKFNDVASPEVMDPKEVQDIITLLLGGAKR